MTPTGQTLGVSLAEATAAYFTLVWALGFVFSLVRGATRAD